VTFPPAPFPGTRTRWRCVLPVFLLPPFPPIVNVELPPPAIHVPLKSRSPPLTLFLSSWGGSAFAPSPRINPFLEDFVYFCISQSFRSSPFSRRLLLLFLPTSSSRPFQSGVLDGMSVHPFPCCSSILVFNLYVSSPPPPNLVLAEVALLCQVLPLILTFGRARL